MNQISYLLVHRKAFLCVAVLYCGLYCTPIAAQNTALSDITVSVGVKDKVGHPAPALSRDDFTISGGKDEVVSLSKADTASVAIVIDLSVSVAGPKLVSAANEIVYFLEAANKANRYFVIGFGNDHQLFSSGDNSEALAGLRRLRSEPLKDHSALYDACWFAIERVTTHPHQSKAIILISDGRDTYSRAQDDDVRRFLKETGVTVYSLDIGPSPESGRRFESRSFLETVAYESGGLYFHIQTPKDVRGPMEKIATDLDSRYIITFKPQKVIEPGKCYSFKVEVIPVRLKSISLNTRRTHCTRKTKT